MSHVLAERTYLDRDGKVVPEGSPAAATLLGIAGDEIDDARAAALGLVKAKAKGPEPDAEAPTAPEPDTRPKRRKG